MKTIQARNLFIFTFFFFIKSPRILYQYASIGIGIHDSGFSIDRCNVSSGEQIFGTKKIYEHSKIILRYHGAGNFLFMTHANVSVNNFEIFKSVSVSTSSFFGAFGRQRQIPVFNDYRKKKVLLHLSFIRKCNFSRNLCPFLNISIRIVLCENSLSHGHDRQKI